MGRKRSKTSGAQWWAIGLVAVVVAITGGLVGAALTPKAPPVTAAPASGTNDYSGYFQQSDDATARAIFVGDSYSHGTGASDRSLRWTSLVSTERGWEERNEALGGTGYLTTSGRNGCGREYCPNYLEVIQQMNATAPEVLFIAGGQNDFRAWTENPQAVTDAIWATYREARTRFPETRIVAVGPSIIGDVSQNVIDLDAQVRAAAEEIGAEYVSLIDPDVLDRGMDVGDGGHVNDAGHGAIAAAVLAVA